MSKPVAAILLFVSMAFPFAGMAQEASEEPLEIRESGQEYLSATRFRRVDSDMAYYDPTRPPPPLETNARPPEPDEETDPVRVSPWAIDFTGLVIGLAIIGIIAIVVGRHLGSMNVSFANTEDSPVGRRKRKTKAMQLDDTPADLAAIKAIADRRLAIIALAQGALARAAVAEGMLLHRSWTARDVLRRVSGQHFDVAALRAVVLASELVHFGQRDISEDEFSGHVERIRPLFSTVPV